jgi:hypothetical protein
MKFVMPDKRFGHPDGATGQRIVHKEQKAPGS